MITPLVREQTATQVRATGGMGPLAGLSQSAVETAMQWRGMHPLKGGTGGLLNAIMGDERTLIPLQESLQVLHNNPDYDTADLFRELAYVFASGFDMGARFCSMDGNITEDWLDMNLNHN